MRIVIITGQQPHHKYLCGEVASRHELVGVFHPLGPKKSPGWLWRKLRREAQSAGVAFTALRVLAKRFGWPAARAYAQAEKDYFAEAGDAYARIPSSRIFAVRNINAPSTIERVARLNADVTICLGGPVYRRPLIEACAPMFNFHSGLSPLYNGTSTIDYAFAMGHPHLCGGTLMLMSTVLDGGDILGHYLPSISPGDTPATLSMKTIRGAAKLYLNFLAALERGEDFQRVPQGRPLFYVRARDWTLNHSLRLRALIEEDIASKYQREERLIEYWREPSGEAANSRFRETLLEAHGLHTTQED